MEVDLIQLFMEYLGGEMEVSHRERLMHWVEESEENRLLFERVCFGHTLEDRLKKRERIDVAMAIREFDRQIGRGAWGKTRKRYVLSAAVVILLVSIGGGVLWLNRLNLKDRQGEGMAEIVPGSAKAVLVLANGQEVKLASQDSLWFDLGEGKSVVNRDERLTYDKAEMAEVLQYNELKIPRGGEYQVVLSDGTSVHLNSASSLKYPIAFGKEKREVELTGEAFFEVSKDSVPFLVRMGDMTVKVYGTTFNINGHFENTIQTALVEGKVGITVKENSNEYLLTSSQLADFNTQTGSVNVRQTDLTPYYAWTKGLLIFNNETLEQIMSTLSLWYDMEVFYQNPMLKELHFTGYLKRYDRIDIILKALSQSVGVKFNQQGKTLTISM